MDLPLPNPTPSPSPGGDPVAALLAPALAPLAADLNASTADLLHILASPELTDKLAAIIANLEALEHLRALAARAPATATAACRSLLRTTDDPVEQRRLASTLLRPSIHTPRPRTQPASTMRTRSASKRLDPHPPTPSQSHHTPLHARFPAPHSHTTPPPDADATFPTPTLPDLDTLLALLLDTPPAPDAAPTPPANPHPDLQHPGLRTQDLPHDLPVPPTLHRRTPPSRAAKLLTAAASPTHPPPKPP